jgi:hypothetical protein
MGFRGTVKWVYISLLAGCLVQPAMGEILLDPVEFIERSFTGEPEKKVLWLNKDLKGQAADIMGHPYKGLRVRYWALGNRTAWILEEIGKVELITAGFVVEQGRMVDMQVLVYRESHGWEVRYPFFTDQFKGLGLKNGRGLDRKIDGISGATLSVNALVRLSELALFFAREVAE